MLEFTEKDLEILLEAIDAWQAQPQSDGATSSLIGGLMAGMAGASRMERESEMRKSLEESKQKGRARASIAILLKAKVELQRQEAQRRGIASAGSEVGS